MIGIRPDGAVSPSGITLRTLIRLSQGLKLNPIGLKTIEKGGYRVSYGPSAPPAGYKVWLGVSTKEGDFIDVTGASCHDAVTAEALPGLLRLISAQDAFGKCLSVKLFLTLGGTVLSESLAESLVCPVPPYRGKLLPLSPPKAGETLTYQGDAAAKSFFGRMLASVSTLEEQFFCWAGQFETDTDHRGFDCTTYAGTVCGVPRTKMSSSADIVSAAGAQTCSLEVADAAGKKSKVTLDEADPAHVKTYFESNPPGYFLLYSAGHIVVVANGTVHEFAASKGYAASPIKDWLAPYTKMKLTLRKLPGKPAMAA